jgi:hypothetical protein
MNRRDPIHVIDLRPEYNLRLTRAHMANQANLRARLEAWRAFGLAMTAAGVLAGSVVVPVVVLGFWTVISLLAHRHERGLARMYREAAQ